MTFLPPTVEVFREVLNFSEEILAKLGAIAAAHGVMGARNMKPLPYIRCILLTTREVDAAVNAAGVTLTNAGAENLADHVADSLPGSADSITIPALPLLAYASGSKDRPYALGFGAMQPILLAEQQAARKATAEWLGLPPDHPVWNLQQYEPMVCIATGRRNPMTKLQAAYQNSKYVAGMTLELRHPHVDALLVETK